MKAVPFRIILLCYLLGNVLKKLAKGQLHLLGIPREEQDSDEDLGEEIEDEAMIVEGAIAQCLYLRYGLDQDYRNEGWGGDHLVSSLATSCLYKLFNVHI